MRRGAETDVDGDWWKCSLCHARFARRDGVVGRTSGHPVHQRYRVRIVLLPF